jgi:hypothetical protein
MADKSDKSDKASATQVLIAKAGEHTKEINELRLTMIANHTTLLEQLETIQQKLANQEKKKPATRGGTKAASATTPTGKRKYSNKMIWWKDMYAANAEQYNAELFTPELESDKILEEAEAEMQKTKNKDKEGEAKLKAMADHIWKNYLKVDTHKAFKDAVLKKYDEYNADTNSTEASPDADDNAEPAVPESDDAPGDDDAPANDNTPSDADEDGDNGADDDEDTVAAKKPAPKKTATKAVPPKKAAAPAKTAAPPKKAPATVKKTVKKTTPAKK